MKGTIKVGGSSASATRSAEDHLEQQLGQHLERLLERHFGRLLGRQRVRLLTPRFGLRHGGTALLASRRVPGAETLNRTPLYDRHEAAGAKLVPFAGWEMPVQYAGIREEHLAVRERRRRLRRLAHGRDRDARARRREEFLQRLLSNDVRQARPRAARSTACSAARTAACSTTSSPTGSADDRFLTVTNAANHEKDLAWFARAGRGLRRRRRSTSPTDYAMLAVQGPDARGHRASASPTASSRRACTCASASVAGVPALVCGTGYTGEDGVELLLAPERRRRGVGRAARRRRDAGRARRARHAAPRGLLPPLRQRPDGGRAGRSRPASAGAARRTRASSAPRRCARRAQAGPAEKLVPFVIDGPGHRRARATRCVGGGEVTSGTHVARASSVGIGMAYVPAERAEPGTALEIDVRGKARAAERAREAPLPKGELTVAEASYPDDLLVPPRARLGAHRRRRGHVRDHLVRAGPARRGRVLRPARGRDARSTKDEPYAEVESVKAVSDVFAPLSGEIVEVNEALADTPEQINEDPYGEGWLVQDHASPTRPRRTPCWTPPPTRASLATMSRYTSATDADRARDARRHRRRARSRSCSPTSPRACASTARSTCRPGTPEQEVYARPARAGGAQRRPPRTRCSFLGAGMYDHYVPGADRLDHPALGVPHAVHALPAGDLPGRAAGDVRVPDRDLASSPACRSPTPPSTRARRARRRRRLPGEARDTGAARFVVSARRAPAQRARRSRTTAAGWGTDVVEVPLRRRRDRRRRAGRGDRRGRRARCSSQQPNFLGAVEDLEALAAAAQRGRRAAGRARATRSRSASCAPPGECGVDIAVGEGQTLGNRLDFGGPSFGFFAASEALPAPHARPDRRRDDATSTAGAASCSRCRRASSTSAARRRPRNICTAQALNALAGVDLPDAGSAGAGIVELGELLRPPHRLRARAPGGARRRRAAARAAGRARVRACALDAPVDAVLERCAGRGRQPRLPLGRDYPEHEDGLLVAITEQPHARRTSTGSPTSSAARSRPSAPEAAGVDA